jgi:hypothetical protein
MSPSLFEKIPKYSHAHFCPFSDLFGSIHTLLGCGSIGGEIAGNNFASGLQTTVKFRETVDKSANLNHLLDHYKAVSEPYRSHSESKN